MSKGYLKSVIAGIAAAAASITAGELAAKNTKKEKDKVRNAIVATGIITTAAYSMMMEANDRIYKKMLNK